MATPISWLMIEKGWDVVTSDGAAAARVTDVLADEERDIFDGLVIGIHVAGHRLYLPSERVTQIVVGRVKVDLDHQGLARLDRYPRHG